MSDSSSLKEMVRTQIYSRHISDPRILQAFLKVDRKLFVPTHLHSLAYSDQALPIGSGQTISQPYIVAFITEAAGLLPNDRVLEVGLGSGYQAAILSQLVSEVYGAEFHQELAEETEKRLRDAKFDNVHVKAGDGTRVWEIEAPFDAIIISAATPEIPMELWDQLKTGGRLIAPLGEPGSFQHLTRFRKTKAEPEIEELVPVRFVPLLSAGGF